MLLFKAFFRKKQTIIYALVFITLFWLILTLHAFAQYYNDVLNHWNETNNIIYVEGEKNHFEDFKKFSNIIKVQKYVKLKFNKEKYPILKESPAFITSDGNDIAIPGSGNKDTSVTWSDFFFMNNYVMVLKSENETLKDDEMELLYTDNYYDAESLNDISELVGEKLAFYTMRKEPIEFKIVKTQNSVIPAISVSKNVFNKLYEKDGIYAYKLNIDNYKKYSKIVKKIQALEPSNNHLTWQSSYNSPQENGLDVKSVVDTLDFINIVLIYVVGFLGLILLSNMLFDENKNLMLQKYLGFHKVKRRVMLWLEVFSLIFISLMLALIISIITNLIVIHLGIHVSVLSLTCIFVIIGVSLLVSLFGVILKRNI